MSKVFSKTTKRLYLWSEFQIKKHSFDIIPWVQVKIERPLGDGEDHRVWQAAVDFGWMVFSASFGVCQNEDSI